MAVTPEPKKRQAQPMIKVVDLHKSFGDRQIILYDEPTTGLDPVMSTVIEDYMIRLEQQLHAASIVVTHQLSTWTRTADRVVLLNAGHIVWEGTPDEARQTGNESMRQF